MSSTSGLEKQSSRLSNDRSSELILGSSSTKNNRHRPGRSITHAMSMMPEQPSESVRMGLEKRQSLKSIGKTNTLGDNDLALFNVPPKHRALVQRTEQKVFTVFNEIEKMLENLPQKVQHVREEHKDMLNHQFNPKLSLAEEKVGNLKNIVDQKKQERDSLEQLIVLNRHIDKYKMTKY